MKTKYTTVVTVTSWFLLVCSVSCQNYNGTFGNSYVYKCRCSTSCDSNGTCTNNGRCLGGWFGPECQYVDLAYNRASEPVITDGNDTTCVSSSNADTVTIGLDKPYPFTWLRVRLSGSRQDVLDSLQVEFMTNNSKLNCVNPRNATVDDTTIDIHCDLKTTVESVILSGEATKYLCSVYISGGRNVALYQPTTQSSTYSETSPKTGGQLKYFPSSNAVDGDTSRFFYERNGCTHTLPYQKSASWEVTFSQPQNINRFIIYNRNESADRLNGFQLQCFSTLGKDVCNYTDQNITKDIYNLKFPNLTSPVSQVKINISNKENILTLCEVEIYGDTSCQSGRYGRDCEHSCHCFGNETCFVSTGGCPSGCPVGYMGTSCNRECNSGTYGQGCKFACSQNCVKNDSLPSVCDHVDGTCLSGCQTGYNGTQCSDMCRAGTYGTGCNFTCSPYCKPSENEDSRPCDHVDGKCPLGCENGYQGSNCDAECGPGKYGTGCSMSCSEFCASTNNTNESPCNHVNGTCLLGCMTGYTSSLCAEKIISPDDDDDDIIIAAVVGSLVAVAVIILVVVGIILWRRHKNKSKEGYVNNGRSMNSLDSVNSVASLKGPEIINTVSKPTAKKRNNNINGNQVDKGDKSVYYNTVATPRQTVVSLEDLPTFLRSKDRNFFIDQFNEIPSNESASTTVGTSAENKHKNRYKNIAAYDHSRVHLIPHLVKKHGDYINASYVEGYKSDEKFIASQGPTKVMLEDFVRMLWEQQVEKVVMLTNLVEGGKIKSERYWPEDDEMKIGEITVRLTTTQIFADYTIRRLQLRKEGQPVLDLTHFHFTSWPDKDVPTGVWGLVDFEQRVALLPTSKPIVVHCSAGVGRTGTFIALRNVMRQAEETGQMDFFTTVQKLRHDRINMVQTVDQYIFLHRAAHVAMLCIGTTFTLADASNRIESLEIKTGAGKSKMEHEFQSICSVCEENEEVTEETPNNVYENSKTVTNSQRNRDRSILPKEMFRAKLAVTSDGLSDYINAVLVPSFSKHNQQILTQLPLPNTVTDFWRLVTQYNVSLIVAFETDTRETDETVGDYLPSGDDQTSNFSMFQVRTDPVTESTLWKQQKVFVTNDSKKESKEHRLLHLTVTHSDLQPQHLLSITEQIRSLNSTGDGRTLYMCRNGATYSGLVCVLSLLLDRMDNDHQLTVPLVVGAIKAIRPQVISSLDQYRVIYQVLRLYSESMNEYSNFQDSTT